MARQSAQPQTIVVNPSFMWILLACTLVLLVCLVFLALAAWKPGPSEPLMMRYVDTLEKITLTIVGSFVGLLGGRAAAPDPKQG